MKKALSFLLALILLISSVPALPVSATEVEEIPVVIEIPEQVEIIEEETEPVQEETEAPVEEETVPEETVPEETVSEETVPEETVPEETVPDVAVANAVDIPEGLSYTVTDGIVTIDGYIGAEETLVIPATIEDCPVEVIAAEAFVSHPSLVKVTLPDTLKRIEEKAFSNCQFLEYVNIPDSVTSIADYAFANTGLYTVTFPAGLQTIGSYAFECENLWHVLYKGTGEQWNEIQISSQNAGLRDAVMHFGAKGGEVVAVHHTDCTGTVVYRCDVCGETLEEETATAHNYVDGVCSVCKLPKGLMYELIGTGKDAYYQVNGYVGSVKNLTIPETIMRKPVKAIMQDAFRNNTTLESVVMPDSIQNIVFDPVKVGTGLFSGCTSLTSVKLSKNLKEISNDMFNGCTSLATIELHEGIYSIGMRAFAGCTSLAEVAVPATVQDINDSAFAGCKSLKKVTLPENLMYLNGGVFADCTSLESITIPAGVTYLYGETFLNCSSLAEVNLPAGLTHIGDYEFEGCSSLVTLTIPAAVESVGFNAFSGCTKLWHVLFTGTQEQLDAMTIGEGNDVLKQIPVHAGAKGDEIAPCEQFDCTTMPLLKCSICEEILYDETYVGEHDFDEDGKCKNCPATNHPCANGHGETELKDVKDATCTEPGYTGDSYCKVCGEKVAEGEEIPVLGHDYVKTVVEPTCTKKGYDLYTCSRCDASYQDNYTDAKGLPVPAVSAETKGATGKPAVSFEICEEADGYEILRSDSADGTFTSVVVAKETPWQDIEAEIGKTYYYKVRAVCTADDSLSSDFSEVVSAKAICGQPQVTVAPKANTGKPVVSWEKVEGAKKYEVWRATSETGKFKKVTTTTKLSYTDTKATLGKTYYYKVKTIAAKSANNSDFCPVQSCVCSCAQPAFKLSITAATGKPSISWKKVTGAKKYEIYRAFAADGEYELLATQTALTYKDATAPADTDCFYKVVAVAANPAANSVGVAPKSIHSTLAQAKVKTASDTLTGIPTVSWEAVEGAVSYEVSRSAKAKGTYKVVNTTSDLSFVDETATGGKTYYYKVTAIAASGTKSAASAYKSAKCVCAQPQTAIAVDAAKGKPTVSWTKVSGAKKYEIWRAATETGKYKKVATVSKLTYTDTGAAVGKTYFYKVKAVASSSTYNSAFSAILSEKAICAQPAFTVKVNTTTGKPELSWKKITGASKYEILRATAIDGVYESLATQTALTYKDTAADADVTYFYKVNAIAADPANNSVDATPRAAKTVCAKPVIKTAKAEPITGKPMLTWDAVDGAVSYEITRATKKNGTYTAVATAAEPIFLDESAVIGKTYYYKVTAVAASGAKSLASAYKSVTCKCGQPILNAEPDEDSYRPFLTWNAVEGAKKYEVWRANSLNGKYTKIKTVSGLYYTDTTAKLNKTYFYKLRAVGSSSASASAYSPIVACIYSEDIWGEEPVVETINIANLEAYGRRYAQDAYGFVVDTEMEDCYYLAWEAQFTYMAEGYNAVMQCVDQLVETLVTDGGDIEGYFDISVTHLGGYAYEICLYFV